MEFTFKLFFIMRIRDNAYQNIYIDLLKHVYLNEDLKYVKCSMELSIPEFSKWRDLTLI